MQYQPSISYKRLMLYEDLQISVVSTQARTVYDKQCVCTYAYTWKSLRHVALRIFTAVLSSAQKIAEGSTDMVVRQARHAN